MRGPVVLGELLSSALDLVFEESTTAAVVCEAGGTVMAVNRAAEALFGVEATSVVGRPVTDLISDRHRRGAEVALGAMAAGSEVDRVIRFDRRDGPCRWAHVRFRVAPAAGGGRARMVILLDEVAEDARGSLADVEQRLAVAFDHAPIGMATVGPDGRFLLANRRLCSLLGYREEELQQRGFEDVTHPDDRAAARREYEKLLAGELSVSRAEKRYVTASGTTVWVRRVASVIRSAAGEPRYIVIQVEDTTEERRTRDELVRLAYTDALTGLANRAALLVRTEEVLAVEPASMLLIDLDDFKKVNDTLGHEAGDRLLTTFAERLASVVEAHAGGAVVARLGGDEFVVAGAGACPDDLLTLAEHILEAASVPFDLAAHPVYLGASVGIATGQRGGRVGEMLRQADLALYTAKRAGKGRAVRFSADLHLAGTADLDLEAALRRAVADEALTVHYQPVYRVADGTPIGVEALCRWVDPDHGPIPPDVFIPLAERCGLIHDLGAQVLEQAASDIPAMAARAGRRLSLAVNVSPVQLGRPDFAAAVAGAMRTSGLAPGDLTIEVTETALSTPGASIDAALAELRHLGVRLGLDDFGTGYSSIGRLRTTHFDVIKVDRSFVAEITAADAPGALAAAAIALGHALGADVVAEGIETPEQLERLRELGCDHAQGYLLGRPRAAADLDLAPAAAGPGPAAVAPGAWFPGDEALVRRLLEQLQATADVDSVFLTSIDWRGGRQRLEYVHNGRRLHLAEGLEVAWATSLCRRAFLRGTPVNEDASRDARGMAGAEAIGRHIAVPVTLDDGTTYGTLCGASGTPGPIGPAAQRSFAQYATLIAHLLTSRRAPAA